MGTSTTTQDTSSKSSPWDPQAAALSSAFKDAQGAYKTSSQAVAPNDFIAQFTPDQLSTFRSMLGYSSNTAVPDIAASIGGALSNAGSGATTKALTDLGVYDPTRLNNPDAVAAAARQYADGQNIDAQTNAAMRTARETVRDVTLPGIEQNAALTNNTNSSRTGIAQGLVERSLAENALDTRNSLYGKAYGDGLSLASANANANNASRLGALSTAASAGTAAANSGVNAGSTSINDRGNLFSLADAAGSGEQAAAQAGLDNSAAQYQSKVQAPFSSLQQLMQIIGSQNWGQNTTGTATTTKDPSAFEVIGGLLGAAGSAKKAFW